MTDVVAIATEQSSSLAELLNQEAGQTGEYEIKVLRNELVDYSYTWQGKEIQSHKVMLLLQSRDATQYCLGFARLAKKNLK